MNNRTYRISLLVVFAFAVVSLPWMPRLLEPAYAGPQDSERDVEFEEEPEDRVELLQNLELARAEAQVDSLRLEIAERRLALVRELASVSEDKVAAAAYGLMRVSDYMDDKDAAAFLRDIDTKATDASVKRLIRIRLAELDHDGDELKSRKEYLRELILVK